MGGSQESFQVLDWIYEGSNEKIRMDRKFALYNAIKSTRGKSRKERGDSIREFKLSDDWIQMTECSNEKCPMMALVKPPVN